MPSSIDITLTVVPSLIDIIVNRTVVPRLILLSVVPLCNWCYCRCAIYWYYCCCCCLYYCTVDIVVVVAACIIVPCCNPPWLILLLLLVLLVVVVNRCCLPLPYVLTHKLANGNTLAANVMSIVLYKYSGSPQGPSPRFSREQYAMCVPTQGKSRWTKTELNRSS